MKRSHYVETGDYICAGYENRLTQTKPPLNQNLNWAVRKIPRVNPQSEVTACPLAPALISVSEFILPQFPL